MILDYSCGLPFEGDEHDDDDHQHEDPHDDVERVDERDEVAALQIGHDHEEAEECLETLRPQRDFPDVDELNDSGQMPYLILEHEEEELERLDDDEEDVDENRKILTRYQVIDDLEYHHLQAVLHLVIRRFVIVEQGNASSLHLALV